MRRLRSYKHIYSKHPIISHTPMWKESNHPQGTAMPQKPSSTKKYAPMQSTPDEIYQSCLMLQCEKWCLISSEGWPWLKNPSSTERSMPWHNGHLKNQTSTKKGVPQCDVSNRMVAYPIKKKLSEVAMPQYRVIPQLMAYHNQNALQPIPSIAHMRAIKTRCMISWPQGALKT